MLYNANSEVRLHARVVAHMFTVLPPVTVLSVFDPVYCGDRQERVWPIIYSSVYYDRSKKLKWLGQAVKLAFMNKSNAELNNQKILNHSVRLKYQACRG